MYVSKSYPRVSPPSGRGIQAKSSFEGCCSERHPLLPSPQRPLNPPFLPPFLLLSQWSESPWSCLQAELPRACPQIMQPRNIQKSPSTWWTLSLNNYSPSNLGTVPLGNSLSQNPVPSPRVSTVQRCEFKSKPTEKVQAWARAQQNLPLPIYFSFCFWSLLKLKAFGLSCCASYVNLEFNK